MKKKFSSSSSSNTSNNSNGSNSSESTNSSSYSSSSKSSPTSINSSNSDDDDESTTVYITKSGKKYHRSSCSSLRNSKIPISLEDAQNKGYTACKNCKP